jgi:hypothetical protein
MSGDAKECREHALRCEQFAEHVPTLTGRQMYLDLARTWRRLGEELESAQSFVALVNGMAVDQSREPLRAGSGRALIR